MSSLFGFEASRAAQFVIAFAIILVLVALLGLVLRKLTGGRMLMSGGDRSRSRQPRLGIVDVYDLDRQRQLLLLRRDNVEHLLLIGGPNDVVIETNIVRVAGARLPAGSGETGAERFEPSFEQAGRPAQVEPSGRPSIEAQLAAQLGAMARPPAAEEESDAEEELAPVTSMSAPIPAHAEPVLRPDHVKVTGTPAVQGLRTEARMPPAPEPNVQPEPRPAFTPPPFQSRPTPVAPPVAPPAPPAQPKAAPAAQPDAVVLSDMAKQLEEALKRPARPVTTPVPPPVATEEPLVRAVSEEVEDEDDLLEPAPAEEAKLPANDISAEQQDEEEKDHEEEKPAPAAASHAEKEPEAAQPSKAADPFSVDEIEAEFARLLGRPIDQAKKG